MLLYDAYAKYKYVVVLLMVYLYMSRKVQTSYEEFL